MPANPPLLPSETLRRVLRTARFDGTVVLIMGAAFGLAAASAQNRFDTLFGLLGAATGAMELHGAGLLRIGARRGMNWLVGSQACLMLVILAYAGLRLRNIDLSVMEPYVTDEQRKKFVEAGLTLDQALKIVYVTTFAVIGFVTLVYQGGMMFYYRRRRKAVDMALQEMS